MRIAHCCRVDDSILATVHTHGQSTRIGSRQGVESYELLSFFMNTNDEQA